MELNWKSFELLEQPADWNSSSQAWYHSLQSFYNLGLNVSWEIVKKFDLIAPWIRERRSVIGQSSPNPAFSLVETMLWVKLCQCIKTICSKLKNNLSVETLNCNLKSSYYRKTFLVFDQNINKIGHSSRSSSIQRSKTTEEVSGNVKQFWKKNFSRLNIIFLSNCQILTSNTFWMSLTLKNVRSCLWFKSCSQ